MRKFFVLLLLLVPVLTDASTPAPRQEPDSANFKWIDGKKYLLHKVRSKETWNGIANKYGMAISDIMKANLGVVDLKAGQILNIPADRIDSRNKETGDIPETPTPPAGSGNGTAVFYTVHEGETLYAISRKFNVEVVEIKRWNGMNDDIVKTGQKLIVSRSGGSADPVVPASGGAVARADDKATDAQAGSAPPLEASIPSAYERVVMPMGKTTGGKKLSKVTETGICSWIKGGSLNQSKFYALHRTAPAGTIIKVTNKMNDQNVFVKVVGVLPDTGDNQHAIIKISESAVKKLGALDAQFLVELNYGIVQ